ncbi:MAG: (Fe-S)-binding protein [Thermodesulfobacteriota bacterium]
MKKNIPEFSALRDIYSEVKAEMLETCSLCGHCLDVCPVYPLTSFHAEDPSEVQKSILDALSGEPSDIAAEMADACSGCDQCIDSCPLGLNPFFLKEVLKEQLVSSGIRKPAKPLKVGDRSIDLQELLGSLQISSSQKPWLGRIPPEPLQKDIVLFLGCSVRYQPDKGLALLRLLEMAGMDYIAIEGGDLCCGGRYVRDGDIAQANHIAGQLLASLGEFRPKKVIFPCSSCYKRMGQIFEMLDERPYELQHASTFLADNMHRLNYVNRIEKTVTVHDPCDLRWKRGNTDSVRKLIEAIPGVTLAEMTHTRESTLCCGIGSHDNQHKISKELRKRVLEEAKETGAQVLATVCTGCHSQFCRVQKDYSFEVTHYLTLLAAAAGFTFEDKIRKYLQFETIGGILDDAAEFIETSPYSIEEFRQVLPLFFRSAKP